MTYTPNARPPGRPRSERRKPEGRRPVALSPKDRQHRDNLVAASAYLREEGKADWADSVELVLGPKGAEFADRLRLDRTGIVWKRDPGLAIRMSKAERDRIKAAHEKAKQALPADKRATYSIQTVVEEGFEAFIAGKFSPEQPARSPHGSGEEKVNLGTRMKAEVAKRLERAIEDRADELGWTPVPMHIAAAWLMKKYPAPKKARAAKQ